MEVKVLLIILLLTMVRAASKYYDGPIRPYEFGFNIEGHQHRKESKDKNGIIMGEFGFITADNVYHVTVYATDADGNFKIVSMKNYKLGPSTPQPAPPAPTTVPTTTASTETSSTTPQPFRIITTAKSIVPLTTPKPSNIAACSGCKIPEPPATTTQSTQPESSTLYVPPFNIVNKNDLESVGGNASQGDATTTSAPSAGTEPPQDIPQKLIVKSAAESKERSGSAGPSGSDKNADDADKRSSSKETGSRGSAERNAPQGMQSYSKAPNQSGQDTSTQPNRSKSPSTGGDSDDPMKVVAMHTANMIQHILNGLLYRFNYTVGYHGHHEQGDRQGNKEGGYYSIGRDGIRRGVSYKANEFGFQPHIKFEKVSPEETPREDTEKQAGLKGFDFKWFYGS
uniref:Uncharacterized protein n=1 Tax=Anopheles atroparvus TaxID=41427 RepID=A0A182J9L7_ANOAO